VTGAAPINGQLVWLILPERGRQPSRARGPVAPSSNQAWIARLGGACAAAAFHHDHRADGTGPSKALGTRKLPPIDWPPGRPKMNKVTQG